MLRFVTITEAVIMTATTSRNALPAIHPGEFLAEILEDHGMSQAQLARTINVSPMRVSHLLRCQRPMSAELALRLGRAFGQSPQYWLNLQNAYDLKTTEARIRQSLDKVQQVAA